MPEDLFTGDAFDRLAVAGSQVTGLHKDDVADPKRRIRRLLVSCHVEGGHTLGHGFGAGLARGCDPRLAA